MPNVPNETSIYAWRFAHADGTNVYQQTPQEVGVRYSIPLPDNLRVICKLRGFHATPDPSEAVDHARNYFVERVLLEGDRDSFGLIVAAEHRTTLWRADAKSLLVDFTADCAERALTFAQTHGFSLNAYAFEAVKATRAVAAGQISAIAVEGFVRWEGWGSSNVVEIARAEQAASSAASAWNEFACVAGAFHDAAEAIAITVERQTGKNRDDADAVYEAERRWQGKRLHARLKSLAPVGYTEPAGTWDWDVLTDDEAEKPCVA